MDNEANIAKHAASRADSSSSCTTVCSTIQCKIPKSPEETLEILKDSVFKNRISGMNELDAMAEATREALMKGADVSDILDVFSTKVGGGYTGADIKMGQNNSIDNSGFDPQINDNTDAQMGHIFAYIRYAYKFGEVISIGANDYHDPQSPFWRFIRAGVKGRGWKDGVSKADHEAGLRGASIGQRLAEGNFCLEDFPDILKKELGIDGAEKQSQNVSEENKNQLERWDRGAQDRLDKYHKESGMSGPPPKILPRPKE